MKASFLSLLLFFSSSSFGQNGWETSFKTKCENSGAKVTIFMNPKISSVVQKKFGSLNKTYLNYGYRIIIFSDTDKQKAEAKRNNFMTIVPEIPSYLNYDFPNYKVSVGDYRTKVDAEKAKIYLMENFDKKIYIVTHRIRPPYLE